MFARFLSASFAALALVGVAAADSYSFTLNSAASGLNGTISTTVSTTGTLIGDYDATNNPAGTRTKPGLFGSFGATENLPVNVSLGGNVGGQQTTSSAGTFQLALDAAAGTVSISDYSVDLLHSGPFDLPLSVTLQTESFRTRSPDFLYLGGIPITLPLGNASITSLSAAQVAGASLPGTLTKIGPNRYSFTVTPIVLITASVDVLGNPLSVPGAPLPLPLSGEILLSGNTATLTSVQPIDLTNSAAPGVALPQFPLALPTLSTPANVLMNLTLDSISGGIQGTLNTQALGTLIPEPGMFTLAIATIAAMRSVRRR
ncbi:MAG: hypothetical protein U1D55_15890 [Phycisphaerae bacterium]